MGKKSRAKKLRKAKKEIVTNPPPSPPAPPPTKVSRCGMCPCNKVTTSMIAPVIKHCCCACHWEKDANKMKLIASAVLHWGKEIDDIRRLMVDRAALEKKPEKKEVPA